jgi:hypothetical protein
MYLTYLINVFAACIYINVAQNPAIILTYGLNGLTHKTIKPLLAIA